MDSVLGNILGALSFVVLVQVPLTLFYVYRLRRAPASSQHLRKRLYALPAISIPWGYYSRHQLKNFTDSMHDKYLKDLSDVELDTFDQIYCSQTTT